MSIKLAFCTWFITQRTRLRQWPGSDALDLHRLVRRPSPVLDGRILKNRWINMHGNTAKEATTGGPSHQLARADRGPTRRIPRRPRSSSKVLHAFLGECCSSKTLVRFVALWAAGFLCCEMYFFHDAVRKLDDQLRRLGPREDIRRPGAGKGDAAAKGDAATHVTERKRGGHHSRAQVAGSSADDTPDDGDDNDNENNKDIPDVGDTGDAPAIPRDPARIIGGGAYATLKKIANNAKNVRRKHRPEKEKWAPTGPAKVGGVPTNSYPYTDATPADPCTLTVVAMDPRLPTMKPEHSLWAALESFVVHAPRGACVLLQTSACRIPGNNGADGETGARAALRDIVARAPRPLVKEFLAGSGRVRTAVLDYQKYRLRACDNFQSPNKAWMNARYWRDEFIDAVDNDMILMLQSDAVLCNNLDIEPWREFAFVGAPWQNDYQAKHQSGFCGGMERMWRNWTKHSNVHPAREEGWLCRDGYGPQGNGGLSLRSREWMVKAIEACPSIYSGLSKEKVKAAPCRVNHNRKSSPPFPQEDMYFGTVLRGLNAPMPRAFEAALFASEMIFPDTEARDWHGPRDVRRQREVVAKRLGEGGLTRYDDFLQNGTLAHFLPIGIHKFWWYHEQSFYVDPELHRQCPHLKDIIPLSEIHEEYRKGAERLGFAGYHADKKKRKRKRELRRHASVLVERLRSVRPPAQEAKTQRRYHLSPPHRIA